jgi:hypothetical protein
VNALKTNAKCTPVVTIPTSDVPLLPKCHLLQVATPEQRGHPVKVTPISEKQILFAWAHIISQTALHAMTIKEALYTPQAFSHCAFTTPVCINHVPNYAHYASKIIHLVTGKTIPVTNA